MVLFWRRASVNLGILTSTTNPALKPERGRPVLAKALTVLGGLEQRGWILAAPSLTRCGGGESTVLCGVPVTAVTGSPGAGAGWRCCVSRPNTYWGFWLTGSLKIEKKHLQGPEWEFGVAGVMVPLLGDRPGPQHMSPSVPGCATIHPLHVPPSIPGCATIRPWMCHHPSRPCATIHPHQVPPPTSRRRHLPPPPAQPPVPAVPSPVPTGGRSSSPAVGGASKPKGLPVGGGFSARVRALPPPRCRSPSAWRSSSLDFILSLHIYRFGPNPGAKAPPPLLTQLHAQR